MSPGPVMLKQIHKAEHSLDMICEVMYVASCNFFFLFCVCVCMCVKTKADLALK